MRRLLMGMHRTYMLQHEHSSCLFFPREFRVSSVMHPLLMQQSAVLLRRSQNSVSFAFFWNVYASRAQQEGWRPGSLLILCWEQGILDEDVFVLVATVMCKLAIFSRRVHHSCLPCAQNNTCSPFRGIGKEARCA